VLVVDSWASRLSSEGETEKTFPTRLALYVIAKRSKENSNADYLSSLPIMEKGNCDEEPDALDNFIIRQIKQLPLTSTRIAQQTRKYDHLEKIIQATKGGQFLKRAGCRAPKHHYQISSGCLIFEHRVVIPTKLRKLVLEELHGAHLRIIKMKSIARSFTYWAGIDNDIENIAKLCGGCAKNANFPLRYSQHHWEFPKAPWERVHIDYAGTFQGKMLLIITDAYLLQMARRDSYEISHSISYKRFTG